MLASSKLGLITPHRTAKTLPAESCCMSSSIYSQVLNKPKNKPVSCNMLLVTSALVVQNKVFWKWSWLFCQGKLIGISFWTEYDTTQKNGKDIIKNKQILYMWWLLIDCIIQTDLTDFHSTFKFYHPLFICDLFKQINTFVTNRINSPFTILTDFVYFEPFLKVFMVNSNLPKLH